MQLIEKMEAFEVIAATIAHEVKSPLSLVQANLDRLRLEDTSEEQRRCYDVMSREVKKANELVKDFLNLVKSAYSMGEAVEVYDVIMGIAQDYEAVDNVSIYVDCPDKNLYVRGNRKLISWVVSNILKNALEAIPVSNGILRIYAYEGKGNVVLEFLDNGLGLSSEKLELIHQGRIVTTKPDGSGIGIAICKNIILDHGGSYCIKNTSGGCLVSITLPLFE